MAKRRIITKKVKGKGMLYLNVCPLSNNETTYTVGNPRTCGSSKDLPDGVQEMHPVCKYFNGICYDKMGNRCVNCTKKNPTHDWDGGILKV